MNVANMFFGLIFALIGMMALVNQANRSPKMLPAWVAVPASAFFFANAAVIWTVVLGPSWVKEVFFDVFWYYAGGLILPAGAYWYFANRNPNKSEFVQSLTS